MMRRLHAALQMLMLTGLAAGLAACGYHLVGQGHGELLQGVHALSLEASGVPRSVVRELRQRLENAGFQVVEPGQKTDAQLRVRQDPPQYRPSAYDRAGIAVQYTLTIRGHMTLLRDGEATWDSGDVELAGDVFVSGGPASIEASRRRLEQDLQRQWLQQVWARLLSGF